MQCGCCCGLLGNERLNKLNLVLIFPFWSTRTGKKAKIMCWASFGLSTARKRLCDTQKTGEATSDWSFRHITAIELYSGKITRPAFLQKPGQWILSAQALPRLSVKCRSAHLWLQPSWASQRDSSQLKMWSPCKMAQERICSSYFKIIVQNP